MEKIFSDYGIEIHLDGNQYILRYDSGGIVVQMSDIPVTEADAQIAQRSAKDAYNVVIKYQNANRKR